MVWLVILLALAGVGLIISEVFIPGGIIGTIGMLALVGSIVLAVMHFSTEGIIATVFLIPIAAITAWLLALRVLPKTRLGKNVFLSTTQEGVSVLADSGEAYAKYIGKRGVAQSYLRPAGVADIEGARVDVVTEGEYLAAGTPVEVLRLEGNHLLVRAVEEHANEKNTTDL